MVITLKKKLKSVEAEYSMNESVHRVFILCKINL